MSTQSKPLKKDEAATLLLPQVFGGMSVDTKDIKILCEGHRASAIALHVLDLFDYIDIYKIHAIIDKNSEHWLLDVGNDCRIAIAGNLPVTRTPHWHDHWNKLPTCKSVNHFLINKVRGFLEKYEFSFEDSRIALPNIFMFRKGDIYFMLLDLNLERVKKCKSAR